MTRLLASIAVDRRIALGCSTSVLVVGCYTGLPAAPNDGEGGIDVPQTSTGAELADTSGSDGETPEAGTTAAAPMPGTSDGGSSGGDPLEPDPEPGWIGAADITPTGVYVNQGVAITLADETGVLPPGARSSRVVHGRDTLVWGTWALAPSFVPRTIRGELHLVLPDGTKTRLVDERMIAGPSGPGMTDEHFSWLLPADEFPSGTRWWVSVNEVEPTADGLLDPNAPRLPASDDVELDDEDGDQRLEVVFVPYRHQYYGCDRPAPSDAGVIDGHLAALTMQYPVQDVAITVHPEVVYTGSLATLDDVLVQIRALRASEAPAADVYYYGLVWPCDASTNAGGLGYIPDVPTAPDAGQYRAAIGVWYDFDPAFSYQTMVHELGHNHGREHVACTGGEADPDPGYPIGGGATGVLGWGTLDQQFRMPQVADYMSYCELLWASTYGWNRSLTVIDALTAMADQGAPSSDAGGDALVMAVRDGEVVSATRVNAAAPRRRDGRMHWTLRDGSIAITDVQRDIVGDSDAEHFTVALPSAAEIDHVELELAARRVTLDDAALTRALRTP